MRLLFLVSFVLLPFLQFAQVEKEVSLSRKGCELKGTFTFYTDSTTRAPLVILIAGSGPTDRDGNNSLMKNNSLKMLSELLVENGHHVLRYDKRSIAGSQIENFDQRDLSFDDFVDDAAAWVTKYEADNRVSNIVLAGHSQGSLVAILAAQKKPEAIDGLISIAGAGEPIHEVLKRQLAVSLSEQMQGLVNAKLDTLASGDTLKHTPNYLNTIMHPSVQPFLISWMKYDPAKEIAELKIPVLIVNGTTDIQVKPSDAQILANSKPEAKLVLVKNMNHVLKFIKETDQSSQLEVYGDPDMPLHKKLKKPLLKFISSLDS